MNFNIVQSRFINEYIEIDKQEFVERLKTHCPVCYLGHAGKAALKQIVKEEKLKRPVITVI